MRIAERVNETFHGPGAGAGRPGHGQDQELCDADRARPVPAQRRPLPASRRADSAQRGPAAEDGAYVKKLARQLLDPATTITAALRLEALGAPSIPTLKVGLHSDVPLVRFAAAESLAYLGSPSCGEELGKQVAEQPFVQAFALTALASLNEAVCRVKLEELLTAPSAGDAVRGLPRPAGPGRPRPARDGRKARLLLAARSRQGRPAAGPLLDLQAARGRPVRRRAEAGRPAVAPGRPGVHRPSRRG